MQSEGKRLLEQTKLIEILQNFGRIDIGGSYVYGTMVDRDIDIALLREHTDFVDRARITAEVAQIKDVFKLKLTDRVHFELANKGSMIWVGLTIIFESNEWNIDIVICKPDSPTIHTNMELHKEMLKVSEEDRLKILELKNQALTDGSKEKGVTSSQIYKDVLKLV